MTYTLEQKVDICLRYITSNNIKDIAALRRLALEALQSDTAVNTDDMIEDLLIEIGMPPHLIGYDCVYHALRMIISDSKYLDDITNNLYTEVAKQIKPGYTKYAVERNIRKAVEETFNRGDLDRIRELFGGTVHVNKGKLTNHEFLYFSSRELRRRMKRMKEDGYELS